MVHQIVSCFLPDIGHLYLSIMLGYFLKGIFEQLIIGSIIKIYYMTKCAEYAIGNVKTVHLILLVQINRRELDAHNKSR